MQEIKAPGQAGAQAESRPRAPGTLDERAYRALTSPQCLTGEVALQHLQ